MAKLSGNECKEMAKRIVMRRPEGIGPSAIAELICERNPEMRLPNGKHSGTVRGAVWQLHVIYPDDIAKGANGFIPIKRK